MNWIIQCYCRRAIIPITITTTKPPSSSSGRCGGNLVWIFVLLLFFSCSSSNHHHFGAVVTTALSLDTTTTTTSKRKSVVGDSVSRSVGESALRQVQWLGSRVAQKEEEYYKQPPKPAGYKYRSSSSSSSSQHHVAGIGGSIINDQKREIIDIQRRIAQERSFNLPLSRKDFSKQKKGQEDPSKEKQVWEALANLEQDMQILDTLAGQKPQLSGLEFTLLTGAVLAAAGGPLLLGGSITEFSAPAAAAFTAAIGIGAEYTGRVAVADGKEVAAASIQCAAEAEGFLAQAERAKAVIPLTVGIGATAATFSLLVPVLLESLGLSQNLQIVSQAYLLCPLVAILAAAVASLAFRECEGFCRSAIGVGNRRFARSGLVGRTWLSTGEQIVKKSGGMASKWQTFAMTVLPAPILGSLVPGALPTKTIVIAALAAAQSAYFLTRCESALSRATDAVALKARSAAVCDTYANQGARSAAILPFTSALSGLCAAATAAIVELPFVEALAAAGTIPSIIAQIGIVTTFPALSALFAAAASVSKARCEVDAEAAVQAASTLALPYDDEENDPILRPLAGVMELVRLTIQNSYKPIRRIWKKMNVRRRFRVLQKWVSRQKRGKNGSTKKQDEDEEKERPVDSNMEEEEEVNGSILAPLRQENGVIINGDFQPVNGEPLRSTSENLVTTGS